MAMHMLIAILVYLLGLSVESHAVSKNCTSVLASTYGVSPEVNTADWIRWPVTEADLKAELAAIKIAQPQDDDGPQRAQAWISGKDLLEWNTPLTKKIVARLMAIPSFKEEMTNTPADAIFATLLVEEVQPGGTSNDRSTAWHSDGGQTKFRKQFLLLLYETKSFPTEYLATSNSPELFAKVETISAADSLTKLDDFLKRWPDLKTHFVESGQVLEHSGHALHRRSVAQQTAWRLFLRVDFF